MTPLMYGIAASVTVIAAGWGYAAWMGHVSNKVFQQRLDKLK